MAMTASESPATVGEGGFWGGHSPGNAHGGGPGRAGQTPGRVDGVYDHEGLREAHLLGAELRYRGMRRCRGDGQLWDRARYLRAAGISVVEVERPKRRHLRRNGKSDPIVMRRLRLGRSWPTIQLESPKAATASLRERWVRHRLNRGDRDRSTGGRARTDTVLSHHRILSPARLPIPPLRHAVRRGDYSMGPRADGPFCLA